MEWAPSPSRSVWRKRVHLVGPPESGQVTSVVRYEPRSRFPAHDHPEGEEILVLHRVANVPELLLLGERLRRAVADGPLPHPLTASIGAATAATPDAGAAVEGLWRLVDAADMAMYVAKREGGNRVASLPLRRKDQIVGVLTIEFAPEKPSTPQEATALAVAPDRRGQPRP